RGGGPARGAPRGPARRLLAGPARMARGPRPEGRERSDRRSRPLPVPRAARLRVRCGRPLPGGPGRARAGVRRGPAPLGGRARVDGAGVDSARADGPDTTRAHMKGPGTDPEGTRRGAHRRGDPHHRTLEAREPVEGRAEVGARAREVAVEAAAKPRTHTGRA